MYVIIEAKVSIPHLKERFYQHYITITIDSKELERNTDRKLSLWDVMAAGLVVANTGCVHFEQGVGHINKEQAEDKIQAMMRSVGRDASVLAGEMLSGAKIETGESSGEGPDVPEPAGPICTEELDS